MNIYIKNIYIKIFIYKYLPYNYNMDRISVIIPTYNRFKYLLNTLNSIKKQTYENIEIIVINDGSDEEAYNTYDWEKENIKIIHISNNSKCVGRVRNTGVENASGKYIAFCESEVAIEML